MPVILVCTLLFIVWLNYEKRKTSRASDKKSEDFWKREQAANFSRKKDISNLDYITIPIKNLPFSENCSEEIMSIQENIKQLADKRILKLSNLTNTEIKEQYGAANFKALSEYDTNYMELITLLNSWGVALFKENAYEDARKVFEYALLCDSDIKVTYTTLCQIYAADNETEKIDELIALAENLNTLTKDSIVTSLKNLRSNYMLSSID